MNIAVYCTGDENAGMGHIMRQLVLADALQKRGHVPYFITRKNTAGEVAIRRAKEETGSYYISTYQGDYPPAKLFRTSGADITLIDIENGPSRQTLLDAKSASLKLVVVGGVGFYISHQTDIDELVDLQIHQTCFVTHEASAKSKSQYLSGLDYLILDESFLNARAVRTMRQAEPKKNILISMGGADPRNLTAHIADSLARAFPALHIVAVYGPAAKKASRKIFQSNITIVEAPPQHQLAQLMSESAFIVTAMGMTVYEALCVGVPVCCTAWSKDHEETALHLERQDALAYLGTWDVFDEGAMLAFAYNVVSNKEYGERRTKIGYDLVDGEGVNRVVEQLERLLNG